MWVVITIIVEGRGRGTIRVPWPSLIFLLFIAAGIVKRRCLLPDVGMGQRFTGGQRKVWLELWELRGLLCDRCRHLAQGLGGVSNWQPCNLLPALLPLAEWGAAATVMGTGGIGSFPPKECEHGTFPRCCVWAWQYCFLGLLSVCIYLCRWVGVKCPMLYLSCVSVVGWVASVVLRSREMKF